MIMSYKGTVFYPITLQEAIRIAPIVKEAAEKIGELPSGKIIDIYFNETFFCIKNENNTYVYGFENEC